MSNAAAEPRMQLSELLLFGPREVASAPARSWRVTLACASSMAVHAGLAVALGMWIVASGAPHPGLGEIELGVAAPTPMLDATRLATNEEMIGSGEVDLSYSSEAIELTPSTSVQFRLSAPPGRSLLDKIDEACRRSENYRPFARFFGTTAYGERIVFVLDVSGSMNEGQRFRRAADALCDSISNLNDVQSFCVILFQDRATIMLDGDAVTIPATPDNKERFGDWLRTIRPHGWSDPREALSQAIDLHPDAIFLLSDGEFKSGPRIRRLAGSVLRLVRRENRRGIPIHTIAYEDAANRRTLESLARQSGGTFRFVTPIVAQR